MKNQELNASKLDRKCPVHFYDLIVRSSAKGVKKPGCIEIQKLLAAVIQKRFLNTTLNETTSTFTLLKDLDRNTSTGTCMLLINRSDRKRPDPRFTDFKKKTTRAAGKQVEEGITVSSHALIHPDSSNRCAALLLLTMGTGIDAKSIADLLTRLVSDISAESKFDALFEFTDPSAAKNEKGEFLKYRVKYKFEIHSHKSKFLDDALQHGRFRAMTLTAHDNDGFDQGGNLSVIKRTVTVNASRPSLVNVTSLKKAYQYFASHTQQTYDKARIVYQSTDGDEKSTTLATNDLDAVFTKREHIKLSQSTPDCFDQLNTTIINDLKKLIDGTA